MSQVLYYPPVTVSSTNPSIGTNGAAAPTSSTEVGGIGPDGNLHAISTDNSGVQNVNVSSSALPTGGATAANQVTGNNSLASIDSKLTAPLSVTGPLTDTQLRASAVPVSAASLPLPSGAATSANQATQIASLSSIDSKTPALGQALAAASVPVVLTAAQLTTLTPLSTIAATQSGTWNVGVTGAIAAPSGRAKANTPTITSYPGTPVTSAAYVQIIASTTSATNMIEVFDSSGQTILLAVGAAASEIDQFIIVPGGNGQVPLAIPAGSRISLKATSTSATVGINVINLYT